MGRQSAWARCTRAPAPTRHRPRGPPQREGRGRGAGRARRRALRVSPHCAANEPPPCVGAHPRGGALDDVTIGRAHAHGRPRPPPATADTSQRKLGVHASTCPESSTSVTRRSVWSPPFVPPPLMRVLLTAPTQFATSPLFRYDCATASLARLFAPWHSRLAEHERAPTWLRARQLRLDNAWPPLPSTL